MTARTSRSARVRFGRVTAFFTAGLFAAFLHAQTDNPRIVEFDPSPDHSRVADGVAVVQFYILQFYPVGGGTPLQTIDLGKPAPAVDGKIRVDFSSQLTGWPVAGTVYEARVTAAGPGGAASSTVSNQFTFPAAPPPPGPPPPGPPPPTPPPPPPPPTPPPPTPPPTCSFSLSPTSRSVGAGATSGSIAVSAGSTCSRNAVSSAGWLTITSGGTGTGNGTINYGVATNTSQAARTATIAVGGATFTLTQSGTCGYQVSPSSQSFPPAGGNGTVTVNVGSGCSWTATRSGNWITITSGANGSGNGLVRYRVSSNGSSPPRSGTLTVGGHPVTISQQSAAPTVPAGLRIMR